MYHALAEKSYLENLDKNNLVGLAEVHLVFRVYHAGNLFDDILGCECVMAPYVVSNCVLLSSACFTALVARVVLPCVVHHRLWKHLCRLVPTPLHLHPVPGSIQSMGPAPFLQP